MAAPRELMPDTISYKDDESIVDVGNHREPNLEAIVAANPDLIIQGQRFSKYEDDLKELSGDAPFVDLNVREDQPLDSELKRQTTELGKIFNKESEAKALNKELDDAVAKAKEAYNPEEKVLAINVSGGKLGFIAPEKGRDIGPLYSILVLDRDAGAGTENATPAKEVIENNEALKNVDAIKNGNVVYMLADTYTNESIQTYIEFLKELASSF